MYIDWFFLFWIFFFVHVSVMCFLQHVVRLERLKRETQAQLKTRVDFVERSTVTMTTTWKRTLLSFWKDDNKDSLTSFFTTLFVTAVWTVILPVASPWQPHTASRSAAKLVSCAHGRGCRTIQTQQKLSPEATDGDGHAPQPTALKHAALHKNDKSGHSLQFISSDWSSQSNSPSHLQPALMHMPLLHMNSTDLHGWWDAARKNQNSIWAAQTANTFFFTK